MAASFDRMSNFASEPSAEPAVIPRHPADPKSRKAPDAPKPATPENPAAPEGARPGADPDNNAPSTAADPEADFSAGDPPKPAETPETPAPGDPKDQPRAKRPSELLRAELDKQKARAEKAEKRIAELEAPKDDPEKVELKTKYESADKRLKELENEIRFSNYERSEEYQTKYLKPFQEAILMGRKKIEALDIAERTVPVTDPATGEVTQKIIQKARPATAEDFDRIMTAPSDREARQLAKQLFGEDAAIAIQHREKVLELNQVRHGKLEEYKTQGAEREKQLAEAREKQTRETRELQANLRKNAHAKFIEKYPEVAKADDGDTDGANILSNDIGLIDQLFAENNFPPEKLRHLHAEARNRAAHYGYVVHKNKALTKQLAELQEKLKQYEESDPGEGEGRGPRPKTVESAENMMGVLGKLESIAKPSAGPL